ncbi:MAG: hypothetical protein ACLFUU_13975 [Desulfobacteraceae bacterium]
MPFKDPERKRQYHREYGRHLRKGLTNPLTPDQWQFLQRAAWQHGRGTWELVRQLAALWDVSEFH